MHSKRLIPHGWQSGCISDLVPEGGMLQSSQTDGITEKGHKTILVVEDGEAVRKMICLMLMQSGYTCLEAACGQEALDVLERISKVHLVLTDLIMPGMTGAELAREISKMHPQIRIIFMSGYSDDPVIRSVDGAAGFFLAKPFTASALADRVQQAFNRPWTGLPGICSNA